MFVILIYDMNAKRTNKMLKLCREHLTWVQNSVFEGEISKASYFSLTTRIKGIIKDGDSVIIYKFRSLLYSERDVFGIDKRQDYQFL